jgi:hypothetical protein
MTHLFVHYHLRPGGVTRVIQQQTCAFAKMNLPFSFATISAGPETSVTGEHRSLLALDYAGSSPQDLNHASLLAQVSDLPKPHIWHFHNPTLGCHPQMARLIHELAITGERMILHIHDFAEDGRPQNLRRLSCGPPWFPVSSRIHYIVLTMRDHKLLRDAGLPESQVSLLGNPVRPKPLPRPSSQNARVLYPTRAITRKNIGEMLLLAALAPAGTRFATSLGPDQSQYKDDYLDWQKLATELALPIDWAITEDTDAPVAFEEAISQSTHLLSTSTQEGFGMAFLEAIAWSRPLMGRAIPHIQENLQFHSIEHPHLYDRIEVNGIDFATQPADQQEALIRLAHDHPHLATVIQRGHEFPACDWMARVLSEPHHPLSLSLISPFHPYLHAMTLASIAATLAHAPAGSIRHLDASTILRAFSA